MANDTAVEPKRAADARTRMIDAHGDVIVRAHAASSKKHPDWDVAILLLDPGSDPTARDAARQLGLRLDGVQVLALDRRDLLSQLQSWAPRDVVDGLARAPRGSLKILCVAHHGAALLIRTRPTSSAKDQN